MLRASTICGFAIASLLGASQATAREEKGRTTMTSDPHDATSHAPLLTVHDVSATQLAFAPDGHRWAAADGLRLHTGRDAQLGGSVEAVGTPNDSLAFTLDGAHVRFGQDLFAFSDTAPAHRENGSDASLHDALVAALPHPSGSVEISVVAASPDGHVRAAVGRTRASRKLHGPSGPQQAALVVFASGTRTTAWTGAISDAPTRLVVSDHRVVAAGTRLVVVDAATGQVRLDRANAQIGTVNGLAVRSDIAYTVAADGSVAAIALADGHDVWRIRAGAEPLRAIAVDAAHDLVVAAGWDDTLHVLAAKDGRVRTRIPTGAHVEALALSADGARVFVALAGTTNELRVYALDR